MKITEKQLKNLVKESVQRILNEGHTNPEAYDMWENIMEMIGAEQMLREVWNFMSSDTIDAFIEHIDRHYELGLFNDEEEEYNEDED